jgi:methionyl-tRNA formyltransferase
MRSILVGAVDSTAIALKALVKYDVAPQALLTLPMSKSERHSDYVHLAPLAEQYGVPVIDAPNINQPEILDKIRYLEPDFLFVIGWSQICRAELLSIPRFGAIGCHPAPLPENRGRGVIPWTILQGCKETGMSLFWIDEGMDSGDILLQEKFTVDPDETATTLYEKHGESLQKLMDQAVFMLKQGNAPRIPQDHSGATYCAKRVAEDGFIDWNMSAKSIWTLIRAVTKPYPGAFTFYKGKKMIIWEADYIGDAPYWGLPGQIQAITETGVLVQCGDSKHILLKSVQFDNEPEIMPNLTLKNHDKLGFNILSMYTKLQQGNL